jgi:dihydroflavonol-4-reductase
LEEGCTVHAAVRNKDDNEKLKYLNEIAESSDGSITYFEADLMEEGSYDEAMKGCELVFHTASPFKFYAKDPQEELIKPAVEGTKNVLSSVDKTSTVKRVVFTSSVAAISGDNIETTAKENNADGASWKGLDESYWNKTSSLKYNPYPFSKTLAEEKALELSKGKPWEFVSINPAFVIGPGINPNSTATSYHLITQLIDGSYRWKGGVPKLGLAAVDVRDVADAHYKAGFTEESIAQRYIVSAERTSLHAMAELFHKYDETIYKKPMWKNLAWLFGPFFDGTITREFITNNFDIECYVDNQKSIDDLKMEYRPLEKSLVEFFEQITQSEAFKIKNPKFGNDSQSQCIIL